MNQTVAFIYKWTHIPSLMWYIGSRTAEGCNPDDGYLCSSDRVKPMILESKSDWKREVIATGTPEEMYQLETEILQLFDARKDPRSFNGHNNDGNYYSPIPWNKGKTGLQVGWMKGLNKNIDERLMTKALSQTGEKNHMYGRPSWNKGLRLSDPRVAKYASTLKTNGNRKGKCMGDNNPAKKEEVRKILSQQKFGEKNPSWKGYYVGPDGTKFTSSKEAAKELNVSDVSILRWTKNNKNGWKFIPKTLVATESNVQLNKGENNV